MTERLKNVIQWTLYVLVIIVALITIISLGINILAPTLFPNVDISGFKDYINTSCVFLSFLSVGLGIYSIWQASQSGKQADEMLSTIRDLKYQQEVLTVTLKNTGSSKITFTDTANVEWVHDGTTK